MYMYHNLLLPVSNMVYHKGQLLVRSLLFQISFHCYADDTHIYACT